MERGYVYRGAKPVYWCFDCGSSLAEFEIEYADKTSPTVDVAFAAHDPAALAAAFGLPALHKPAFTVIWTTTPWTLPANQALNLNPSLVFALVDTERGLFMVAEALVDACLQRWGLAGSVLATTLGEKLAGLGFDHPLAETHEGYRRVSPIYLADYATAEDGTGVVPVSYTHLDVYKRQGPGSAQAPAPLRVGALRSPAASDRADRAKRRKRAPAPVPVRPVRPGCWPAPGRWRPATARPAHPAWHRAGPASGCPA